MSASETTTHTRIYTFAPLTAEEERVLDSADVQRPKILNDSSYISTFELDDYIRIFMESYPHDSMPEHRRGLPLISYDLYNKVKPDLFERPDDIKRLWRTLEKAGVTRDPHTARFGMMVYDAADMHFMAARVDVPAYRVTMYDSLRGAYIEKPGALLVRLMQEYYGGDSDEWTVEKGECEDQEDANNCGLFAAANLLSMYTNSTVRVCGGCVRARHRIARDLVVGCASPFAVHQPAERRWS